ncbi:hypothetical protein D3C73_1543060 [compost metagenome]
MNSMHFSFNVVPSQSTEALSVDKSSEYAFHSSGISKSSIRNISPIRTFRRFIKAVACSLDQADKLAKKVD